ncbi:MAG: diacylglycerol kinase family protein [Bacteroidia bacterium]
MKNKKDRFLQRVIKSFHFAFRGIATFLATPSNAWIHLLAAITVCSGGIILHITRSDWALIIIAIALVITAEMFNTALESLMDLVSPDYHKLAERAKDIAAGAVLVTALTSLLIGVLVFWPYFFKV